MRIMDRNAAICVENGDEPDSVSFRCAGFSAREECFQFICWHSI